MFSAAAALATLGDLAAVVILVATWSVSLVASMGFVFLCWILTRLTVVHLALRIVTTALHAYGLQLALSWVTGRRNASADLRWMVTTCRAWVLWWRGIKLVPQHVEIQVAAALAANDEEEVVTAVLGPATADGAAPAPMVSGRVGVALRLAKEVKLRFGGTPRLSEANKLVAARYIEEALVEHGVTRKIDRAKLLYKVRALVFTRLEDEGLEDMWLNSQVAQESHAMGTGWASAKPWSWLGTRRRVPSAT